MDTQNTVRDLRSRQQNKASARVIAITSGQAVERKAPVRAKSVTMPLLIENAPHAYLAHGNLNNLRKSFRLSRTAALDMMLTAFSMAVTGPQERRRA